MGDDMDYDDYGYMYDDPDYIYAEESWDLADELAGNALPQPPFLDGNEDDWDDYDMYEYFEEIEFGNDDYYDKEDLLVESLQAGDKRKSAADNKQSTKRRRVEMVDFDYPPVLWMPLSKAYGLDRTPLVEPKTLPTYALLPDWRMRLKNAHGFATATEMQSVPSHSSDAEMNDVEIEEDEEDREDEEQEEGEDAGHEDGGQEEGEEDEDMEGDIDPEVLRRILAARLAESGIGGADTGGFMESLMQMMRGDGGDDALEQLTSSILDRVGEDAADPATSAWLSNQGVSLPDEEAEGSSGQPGSSGTTSKSTADTDSPKDSVAENLPPTSVPRSTPASKKRKKVSFAPPDRSSFSEGEAKDKEQSRNTDEDQEMATASKPASKRPRRGVAPPAPAPVPKKTTGKLKSVKSRPTPRQHTTHPSIIADKNTDPEAATAMSELDITKDGEQSKETRKRKAPVQEPDTTEEKPKRQFRNFAAPTASSQRKTSDTTKKIDVAKKSTRSGKERK